MEETREVLFELNIAPVSQQARATAKDEFRAELHKLTASKDFLFTSDVRVDVEWFIHEQVRYETDRAADVDNILKPLLDALAGPSGILIDDNQVQSVSCHWLDWYELGVERLRIVIDAPMAITIPKREVRIIQFDRALCIPFPGGWPLSAQLRYLDLYSQCLTSRNEALEDGVDYYHAQRLTTQQRLFHRTRLGQFKVTPEAEFRAELMAQIEKGPV